MNNVSPESSEQTSNATAQSRRLPNLRSASNSNAFAFGSFFVLAALLLLAGALGARYVEADDEKPNSEASTADGTPITETSSSATSDVAPLKNESKFGDIPVKWLPDLKVLAGAPTTTLELDDALQQFCDEGYFGDKSGPVAPSEAELMIVSGDCEAAKSRLNGTELLIDWNPSATGKTKFIVKASVKGSETRRAFISFNAESWRPQYGAIFLTVVGGLGLFLLGMKKMSDGLQAIAGARLRRLISLFTNNRFLAVGVGVLTTTLVQSSSATTVMALGFVNSGLMTLTQAIGVIMGTNIGTTTTGWLLTLNVGALGLPILGVAAFFVLFAKNEKLRNVATFALGLGMIFFGLKTMGSGLGPLPEIPEFAELMRSFEATTLLGAFKCVLIGCITTVLVQSSAATIAITMTLATLGAINFESAAALVLGENIGTTITALLASIGATTNARRAAYFHTLFNVAGVGWALAIFFPILLPVVRSLGKSFGLDVTGEIALTHSLFNVANTLLFLPLIGPVSRLLTKYVKESKKETQKPSATGLASFRDDEPILGVERSRLEVQRMFLDCRTLVDHLKALKAGNFEDHSLVEKSFEIEQKLDDAQDETIDFISRLTSRAFSSDFAASAREQVRLAEEIETISDYLTGVLKSNLKLKESNLALPRQIDDDFNELLQYVDDAAAWLETTFTARKHEKIVEPMTERRQQYVGRVKEIREEFLRTMFDERLDPLTIVAVDYQMNAWRRIYEHLQNIAEAMEFRPTVRVVK